MGRMEEQERERGPGAICSNGSVSNIPDIGWKKYLHLLVCRDMYIPFLPPSDLHSFLPSPVPYRGKEILPVHKNRRTGIEY